MKQFKSRKQNRLNDYDYSNNGYYYVTICTYNRKYIFGNIANDEMILNRYGNIAGNSWLDLPNHHDCLELDRFIIMPNHIHGIIIINNPVGNGPEPYTFKGQRGIKGNYNPVGNRPACSYNYNKYQKRNNLFVIIGSYKSTVTKQINRTDSYTFKWQKSFHDHIIRNDKSLDKIREYIINNSATWEMDENNINYKIKVQAGLNPTRLKVKGELKVIIIP